MLLQQCGRDWLHALAPQLHITPPIIPETLDPALATVPRFPDHVFFLPQLTLLHLEIQASWEPTPNASSNTTSCSAVADACPCAP
jgi:hypothetical protein